MGEARTIITFELIELIGLTISLSLRRSAAAKQSLFLASANHSERFARPSKYLLWWLKKMRVDLILRREMAEI